MSDGDETDEDSDDDGDMNELTLDDMVFEDPGCVASSTVDPPPTHP